MSRCHAVTLSRHLRYNYLTFFKSPKYSSKPIVGVIKKQYLCNQKTKRKSIKILLLAHEKIFLAHKNKKGSEEGE